MEFQEVVNYLAAAAAADEPIDGYERDLMTRLLQDMGAGQSQAAELVSNLPTPFELEPTLDTVTEQHDGVKLLRGLLVIAYSDGTFDNEELPFLTPLVDKFSISGAELKKLKQQALYFIGLRAPAIRIPQEVAETGNWDQVCEIATEEFKRRKQEYYRRFEKDLDNADEETCYLALNVGPPTFDTSHAKNRFLQSNPDFLHLEDGAAIQLLRDNAEKRLRERFEAAYSARCNFCFLEAPGRRRDPCPRCQKEYGESARR